MHLADTLTIFPLSILSNGWIGPAVFILSGFVLYLPYAEGKRRMNALQDAGAYYKRRAARLLPSYYISTLFVMLWWNIAMGTDLIWHLFLILTVSFNFSKGFWMP